MDGKPVEGSLYFYAPNKPAAIVFVAAFAVSMGLHLWQTIRYKSWRVTGYHPFCAALFTAGFAARAYGAFNFDDIPAYITGTILVYAAPPILELANYHVLGRIMYYVPYCAPLHPGRVLTTFGSLSFLVEVLNGIGIAWLTRPGAKEEITKVGDALTKASLILQLGVISLFCVLAALFQLKCSRAGVGRKSQVLKPLVTMYVSMALILVRTVYRVVDHFAVDVLHRTRSGSGLDPMELSPVLRYEWYFYVFEATLMLINMFLWNGLHPMRFLPANHRIYLSKSGHTELEGPGWEDNRPFIATWIDPLGLFLRGKDTGVPFWEKEESKMLNDPANSA